MNISRSEMGGGSAEGDWRELDTTPEFREFVGKKLDQLVEGMIKEKNRCKHLRPVPVEGGVQLFSGSPPLQLAEETPQEPPPPAKRPKLAGVDLQRYQLKKKSRREEGSEQRDGQTAADSALVTPQPLEAGTPVDSQQENGSGDSSDSSDDEDLARFAEAAVPSDFMTSLASSKTVKLDAV